jgi:peroxiredoxin Q/BCP
MGGIIGALMLSGVSAIAGESAQPTPSAEEAVPNHPDPQSTVTTPAAVAPVSKTEGETTPAVGAQAIDFSLTSGEGKPTALKDYRGEWVVLYFYPKDFTGGCTLEAHNFQSDQAKYDKLNAVVLGVSTDSPESHKDFCAKEELSFKLLSDPDAKISSQYGSVMEYQGAKMSARNTFIITPEGKIAKVFTKVNPTAHSEEVLAALDELRKSSPKPKD